MCGWGVAAGWGGSAEPILQSLGLACGGTLWFRAAHEELVLGALEVQRDLTLLVPALPLYVLVVLSVVMIMV